MTPCENCGKMHRDGITIEHRWIVRDTACEGGRCERFPTGELLCAAHVPSVPKSRKERQAQSPEDAEQLRRMTY